MAEEDERDTSLLLLETPAVGEEREREAKRREEEQAHQPPPPAAECSSKAAQLSLSADAVHQAELQISERPKAAEPLPPLRGEGARCDTCSTDEPRYRCPGCHTRSCSLKCVKAHKEQTGCDGQAPRSRFAPHASDLPENVLWHGEGRERFHLCVCCKKDLWEKTCQSWRASLTHVARVNACGAGRGGLTLRQTRGRVWSTTLRNPTHTFPTFLCSSDYCLLEDAARFVGAAQRTHLAGQLAAEGQAGPNQFKRKKNQVQPRGCRCKFEM